MVPDCGPSRQGCGRTGPRAAATPTTGYLSGFEVQNGAFAGRQGRFFAALLRRGLDVPARLTQA